MHRQRKLQLGIVLITSLVLSSLTQAAQTAVATSDWSSLRAVAVGSKLAVKLKNGKTFQGTLNSVSDEALSLSVKGPTQELRRGDVLTVHQITSKSATKATLIGAGVGAGTGAAVGAVGGSNDDGFDKIDHAVTAGLTVVGAVAGAVAGYLVGKGGSKRVLIYKAP